MLHSKMQFGRMLGKILIVLICLVIWAGPAAFAVDSTATFWAFNWGFFQDYYQVPAMLRATGTHAYIFSSEDTLTILALATNPNNSTILAVTPFWVTTNNDTHFIYRSQDGGETWERMSPLAPDLAFTSLVAYPFTATATVFLAGSPGNGAYWSLNDGNTWSNKNQDLGNLNVTSVAISPGSGTPYKMYVGTTSGVYNRGNLPFQTWGVMPHILAGDDFENDSVGVAPTGWFIQGTPTPNEFITVDSTYSLSAPNSMMLHSANQGGNTITAKKGFAGMSEIRWLFATYTDSANKGDGAIYQLMGNGGSEIGVFLARIADQLSLISPIDTTDLFKIKPNNWYSIEVAASLSDSSFDVLVDGDTVATQQSLFSSTLSVLDAISFTVNKDGYTDWVDDISVDPFITSISGDPDSINQVYVGSTNGIFKWSNIDSSWNSINIGLTNTVIQAIAVDPGNGSILYAATAGGIFKSSNGGGSWTAKNSGLTNLDVRSFVIDPNVTTTLYIGTEGNGVYQSMNGGDSWASVNTGFSDWGVSPFINQIPSLTIVSSDTIIAGSRHGIFRSTDGGQNWTEENTGILRTFIKDTAVIDNILDIFDKSTPKDSTRGVYEIVNGAFGDEPDIDNDPRIYIFLLDIPQDPTVPDVFGYFDIENQFPYDSLNHPNSNAHEMIYLDYLDIVYEDEVSELAQNFQRMIHWNNDPTEEAWIVGGMTEFSKFLTGVADTAVTLPSIGLDLTLNDFRMTFLWTDYLFEKYGGLATLKEIVSEPLNGFAGIDAALSRRGYSETHTQIFLDWAIANFLDDPDPAFNAGRYGFDSLQVTTTPTDVSFATSSIYATATPNWSNMYFHIIDLADLGDTLLFNGGNTNIYSLRLVKIGTPPVVEFISLNSTNEARIAIDTSQFQQVVKAVVSVVGDIGTQPALVFSNDLIRPSFVKLGVFQNPQADRFLDLFVFSNERLYEDVLVETPVVEVKQNNTTQQVPMEIFTEPGTDSILVIYKGDFAFSASGIAQIVLTGEDFAGNDIDTVTTGVSVQFIQADEGGEIASIEGEMHLRLPAKSLAKDIYLTVFTLESSPTTQGLRVSSFGDLVSIPEERAPVGFAYRIGPTGLRLKSPARLTIHLEELTDPDPSKLGIYRLEGKNWVYVGGILDEGSLSTEIDILGTYQVQLGPHPLLPSLPKVYTLSQNIPNPMGKVTVILYQLPNDSHVSLKIYNILGQVVKTLINGQEKAGFYSVPWEGKDDTGRNMTSGIYFYTFQAGDFKQTKKLVLLR